MPPRRRTGFDDRWSRRRDPAREPGERGVRPGPGPHPARPLPQVDLHGLPPERALRRLAQELHACRARRVERVLVVTGRGWGNARQEPVLRTRVEAWLAGPDGARLGVRSVARESHGGALVVRLATSAASTE